MRVKVHKKTALRFTRELNDRKLSQLQPPCPPMIQILLVTSYFFILYRFNADVSDKALAAVYKKIEELGDSKSRFTTLT